MWFAVSVSTWHITTNVQTLCWSKSSPSFSSAHSSCISRSVNTIFVPHIGMYIRINMSKTDFIYLKMWCYSVTFCQRGHFFWLTLYACLAMMWAIRLGIGGTLSHYVALSVQFSWFPTHQFFSRMVIWHVVVHFPVAQRASSLSVWELLVSLVTSSDVDLIVALSFNVKLISPIIAHGVIN